VELEPTARRKGGAPTSPVIRRSRFRGTPGCAKRALKPCARRVTQDGSPDDAEAANAPQAGTGTHLPGVTTNAGPAHSVTRCRDTGGTRSPKAIGGCARGGGPPRPHLARIQAATRAGARNRPGSTRTISARRCIQRCSQRVHSESCTMPAPPSSSPVAAATSSTRTSPHPQTPQGWGDRRVGRTVIRAFIAASSLWTLENHLHVTNPVTGPEKKFERLG